MRYYVSKHEIREINKKLFAFDIERGYRGDDEQEQERELDLIISHIIQSYNAEDKMYGVPSVLSLKESNVKKDVVDKIYLLSPASVIIQVNNNVFVDNDKTQYIKQLKDNGYKIMVEINKDDKYFNYVKMIANLIKIDIKNIPEEMIEHGNEFTCKKVAYNVDTAEEYVLAESANIDYYEGDYISTSINMDIRQNGHSEINYIDVLKRVNNNESIESITRSISRDPLLAAQVIRLSNSEYFKKQDTRIKEVGEAVSNIGKDKLKNWVLLLQFNKSNYVPEEIIKDSYQRAELAKELVEKFKIKNITKEQAYLIGLFSQLDILAGRSMNEELISLNLDKTAEDALIYRDGTGGQLINLIIAYEEANWDRVDIYARQLNVDRNKIFDIYFTSLNKVAGIWDELTNHGRIIK